MSGGSDRRLGRPRLFAEASQVSLRLSGELHDRLIHLAAQRREKVSDAHRAVLEAGLHLLELCISKVDLSDAVCDDSACHIQLTTARPTPVSSRPPLLPDNSVALKAPCD